MRVAWLVPEFPCRSETFISGPLRRLVAHGLDVTVFARRPAASAVDPAADRELAGLVRVQPAMPSGRPARLASGAILAARLLPAHPRLVAGAVNPMRFGRYAVGFDLLRAAVPMMDRPSFDVVHCHFGPAGVYGAMLHRLGAIRGPLVATFYGHDVTRYPREHGEAVYRDLFDRARLLCALDPVMRERLLRLGAPPERTVEHPVGVDCDRFAPAAPPPASPLRLISIGRLVEKKGIADGLRAVAELARDGLDVRYRVLGDGPLAASLRGLARSLGIEQVVEFAGAVSNDVVPPELQAAHLLLAPSVTARDGDEEGTPKVVIEAMACGLPVVATRHAGIPSLVEDGRTGRLVAERSPDEIAAAVRSLLDASVRGRFGARARDLARRRHSERDLVDQLIEHYLRVASGSF